MDGFLDGSQNDNILYRGNKKKHNEVIETMKKNSLLEPQYGELDLGELDKMLEESNNKEKSAK